MGKSLTPKQQKFTEEYLVDLNATQAAIRAGYAPRAARQTATKLLSKGHILGAINVLREVERAFTKITTAEVVELLRREAHLASEAGQHAAAIRAAELLGKHDGQFTDKVQVDQRHPVHVEIV